MTSNSEIELHQPQSPLADQMKYAQAVSSANLLPAAYRGKPADIMLAMGLGQAMGLSPAESMYRIDVIQGKPTASAELIASNVRKAGHKLRMKVTENPPSATCTIIRSDDPDEPISITRDVAWARQMDLLGKDNYKKQPSTMLAWRAISACARLACSEALYGVNYTADEMYDLSVPGEVIEPRTGLGAALAAQGTSDPDPGDSPPVEPDAAPSPADQGESSGSEPRLLSNKTKFGRAFYARVGERNFETDAARLEYIVEAIGRFVESTKEMTEAEAAIVMRRLDEEDGITDADEVQS